MGNPARIKCDAAGCDWCELVDDLSPEHIGRLCPKCSAPVLTLEDYLLGVASVAILQACGAKIVTPGTPGATRIGAHGGRLTIEIPRGAV